MKKMLKNYSTQFILFALIFSVAPAWGQQKDNSSDVDSVNLPSVSSPSTSTPPSSSSSSSLSSSSAASAKASGYVAKNESIQSLFNALSSELRKPIVLSKLAQKKTITGNFDISNPIRFIDKLSTQIGLAWYDDGQTIYVYDSSELKNSVVLMRYSSLNTLNEFLQRTGLYSKRYPIRGEAGTGTFYVAGPPVYVDLVVNAAAYLDDLNKNVDLNKQKISVIKLQHTFVGDRTYKIRDQEIKIGGIGKVIEAILSNEFQELVSVTEVSNTKVVLEKEMPQVRSLQDAILPGSAGSGAGSTGNNAGARDRQVLNQKSQIKVIAYLETNSLLVKGTAEQVQLIEHLVSQLDVPKRHIELSLWIIDITKTALDQFGIEWQGAVNVGDQGRVSFNASSTSLSTLNGSRFLAAISALNSKGLAQVVSRPVLLTQDNVPATFDHSNTFYTQVIAERVATLESIQYGTMINVLPRFSTSGDEVEMMLDIEDGQQSAPGNGTNSLVSNLPVVTRVNMSTVARVPRDKSLLIGGFTFDSYTNNNDKIPFLGGLPLVGSLFRSTGSNVTKQVRLYLI